MKKRNDETFVSVDIESSGPVPPRYSMLSVGACIVGDEGNGFYAELRPLSMDAVPDALSISGFDLDSLTKTGQEAAEVMSSLRSWVETCRNPIFVGLNAAFDWAFVNWYFIEYGGGSNPFGIAPLDVKAYAMGKLGISWAETRSSILSERLAIATKHTHQALEDAREQSLLFQRLRMMK